MPTYEYECVNTGRRFELFQSMKDEPLSGCPVCGGTVRRLIGAGAGVIFKGSGFYATDYASSSTSTTSSTQGRAAGGSGRRRSSGGRGSSESRPGRGRNRS